MSFLEEPPQQSEEDDVIRCPDDVNNNNFTSKARAALEYQSRILLNQSYSPAATAAPGNRRILKLTTHSTDPLPDDNAMIMYA